MRHMEKMIQRKNQLGFKFKLQLLVCILGILLFIPSVYSECYGWDTRSNSWQQIVIPSKDIKNNDCTKDKLHLDPSFGFTFVEASENLPTVPPVSASGLADGTTFTTTTPDVYAIYSASDGHWHSYKKDASGDA